MKPHFLDFSSYQLGPNVFHLIPTLFLFSTPGYFKANLKYHIISIMNILAYISKRPMLLKTYHNAITASKKSFLILSNIP